MSQVERALLGLRRWLATGLLVSLALVLLPSVDDDRLLLVVTFHLFALVMFGLGVGLDLARFGDGAWFEETRAGSYGRRLGAGITIVALTTGVVALVTLASSAALGYAPSLQLLQLLSALDIAWAAAALMIGVRWLAGERWAFAAGLTLGVACVWAIWRYLDVVGFRADGGWLVSGADLWRYVLPFDMAAAVIAVAALLAGVRAAQSAAHRGH